jgi:NDP-sugar pyrophosphorylase family protein
MKAAELFALPTSLGEFAQHLLPLAAPWEWVPKIKEALDQMELAAPRGDVPNTVHIDKNVFVHPSVILPQMCTIQGPAWIGANTEIRPGAFLRGNVIVGEGCVLGNACEFKNCLLMDKVQVPHFNYVGDSILGNGAHMAAGVIVSNLRLDQRNIRIRFPNGEVFETGLRKLGALVGDHAEVGCNAVLQPGTIIGRRSFVYPLSAFGGVLPAESIAVPRGKGFEVRSRGL